MEVDIMCKNLSELEFNEIILFENLLGNTTRSEARFSLNIITHGARTTYCLNTSVRVGDKMILGHIESPDTTCGSIIRKLQTQARYHQGSKVKATIDKILKIQE